MDIGDREVEDIGDGNQVATLDGSEPVLDRVQHGQQGASVKGIPRSDLADRVDAGHLHHACATLLAVDVSVRSLGSRASAAAVHREQ